MFSLQGCGYSTHSALAPEWKEIHVAPVGNGIYFANEYELPLYVPLVEVKLRNAVSEKFLKDGYLRTAEENSADVILKTTLKF